MLSSEKTPGGNDMSLKEQMMTGKLYVEWGHASREDQAFMTS